MLVHSKAMYREMAFVTYHLAVLPRLWCNSQVSIAWVSMGGRLGLVHKNVASMNAAVWF